MLKIVVSSKGVSLVLRGRRRDFQDFLSDGGLTRLVELKGEIRLVVISPENGSILWCQQLGVVSNQPQLAILILRQ